MYWVSVFNYTFAPVMLHVVSMLFQEINKHSYGRLCCSPLTMAHNLFHDVVVETLYTDYSRAYGVHSKANAHFISSLWFDTQ